MVKIIDTNRHGIRREIDHQSKKKRKVYKPLDRSNNGKEKEKRSSKEGS